MAARIPKALLPDVVTWLAVLTFVAAALVVPAVCGGGGTGFNGLFIADSFAAFAKLLIYGAAAVALIAASGWFGREQAYRPEYPVLILLSAVGMGMTGREVLWGVELTSPTYLIRAGWKSNTIKPGDKVTITVNPVRSGEPAGIFRSLTLADGRVLTERPARLGTADSK